jgi:hypothetical protein
MKTHQGNSSTLEGTTDAYPSSPLVAVAGLIFQPECTDEAHHLYNSKSFLESTASSCWAGVGSNGGGCRNFPSFILSICRRLLSIGDSAAITSISCFKQVVGLILIVVGPKVLG